MKGVKAILLMAGRGRRFGDPLPKQFHLIEDIPVYMWTLDRLISSGLFEEVLLVAPPELVEEINETVQEKARVISGGETRQASSYAGLIACGPETTYVLIHDAVRPFVSTRILEENLELSKTYGAIDTCIPCSDTLVYSPNNFTIESIPLREDFMQGQTPQTFSYPLILEAHEKTQHVAASDDCQLILELGHPVHIVQGEESNIKITNQIDLQLARHMAATLSTY